MEWGFPGGSGVENPRASEGDTGSIPGWEDSTCHGAAKPVCHRTIEPVLQNGGAATTEACAS